jgi:hypothetical protein
LVLGGWTWNWRLGLPPRRLLAGFLLLSGPFSHFLPIGGLLPGLALGSPPLNLGLGVADRAKAIFRTLKLLGNTQTIREPCAAGDRIVSFFWGANTWKGRVE